jgi:hypothetical protein
MGTVVCAGVFSVALVQLDGKRLKESAERQRESLEAELADVTARLADAERRATDAEKDTGDLLKAVQALKEQQATPVQGGAPGSGAQHYPRTAGGATRPGPEDEEWLGEQRAYQQKLAKRRAEEAQARARVEEDAAREGNAVTRFNRLIAAAEHLAANAEFQAAIRMYNQAMEGKPASLPVDGRVQELKAVLAGQNKPVEVALTSDGLTWVSIDNLRPPERLNAVALKILPGNYQVIGRRKGYKDVVIPIEIRNGVPAPVLSITCTAKEP